MDIKKLNKKLKERLEIGKESTINEAAFTSTKYEVTMVIEVAGKPSSDKKVFEDKLFNVLDGVSEFTVVNMDIKSTDSKDSGIIIDATWNVNSNALGYKHPRNFRESFRNAIIGAKDGKEIIQNLEKEGGILDGWGKARGYKIKVMEEKPQYIKIGFGGQVVLTVSKIQRG